MPRRIKIPGFPEEQRPDERVAYDLTISATYPSPSTPAGKLYDITERGTETDVTASKLSGSAAIVGQVMTSPLVISLVAGRVYRLEFQFVSGGNTFEPYGLIYGVA